MSEHQHDVSIIWEFWPFKKILWNSVRTFLTGHGLNIINNILMEVTVVPRWIWNYATDLIFWPENFAMGFFNGLANFIFTDFWWGIWDFG